MRQTKQSKDWVGNTEALELIATIDDVRYDLKQPAKSSILFTAALKHLFGRRNMLEIPPGVYEPLF